MRTREQEERLRAYAWVPNALTGFRLFIAGPVVFMLYGWEYLAELDYAVSMVEYVPYRWVALAFIAAALYSEWADGHYARKYKDFGWMTEFGRDLDPWADKAFGIWCLPPIVMHIGLEPYLAFVAVPVAYVFFYSFRTQWLRRNKLLFGASRKAKWKTAILMFAQFLAYLAFAIQPADKSLEASAIASAVFTVAMLATMAGAVTCYFALSEYNEAARKGIAQPAE